MNDTTSKETTMKRPQLMSTSQVATELDLDESQVRRLARQLGVAGFKVGGGWLYSTADLDRLRNRPPLGRKPRVV